MWWVCGYPRPRPVAPPPSLPLQPARGWPAALRGAAQRTALPPERPKGHTTEPVARRLCRLYLLTSVVRSERGACVGAVVVGAACCREL
jgi:hypothetical protein